MRRACTSLARVGPLGSCRADARHGRWSPRLERPAEDEPVGGRELERHPRLARRSRVVGALVASRQPGNAVGWLFLRRGGVGDRQAPSPRVRLRGPSSSRSRRARPGSRSGGSTAGRGCCATGADRARAAALPGRPVLSAGAGARCSGASVGARSSLTIVATAVDPGPIDSTWPGTHEKPLTIGGLTGFLRRRRDPAGLVVGRLLAGRRRLGRGALPPLARRRAPATQVDAAPRSPARWSRWILIDQVLGTRTPAAVHDVLFASAVAMVPVAVGVAMLRYRLYDVDRVISRTLVYGSLTVILGAAYVGLVLAGRPCSRRSRAARTSRSPCRRSSSRRSSCRVRARVQRFVDRRFYRRRYDAQRTLEAFGARLRERARPGGARAATCRASSRETMQPAHVSLWLRERPAMSRRRATLLAGGSGAPRSRRASRRSCSSVVTDLPRGERPRRAGRSGRSSLAPRSVRRRRRLIVVAPAARTRSAGSSASPPLVCQLAIARRDVGVLRRRPRPRGRRVGGGRRRRLAWVDRLALVGSSASCSSRTAGCRRPAGGGSRGRARRCSAVLARRDRDRARPVADARRATTTRSACRAMDVVDAPIAAALPRRWSRPRSPRSSCASAARAGTSGSSSRSSPATGASCSSAIALFELLVSPRTAAPPATATRPLLRPARDRSADPGLGRGRDPPLPPLRRRPRDLADARLRARHGHPRRRLRRARARRPGAVLVVRRRLEPGDRRVDARRRGAVPAAALAACSGSSTAASTGAATTRSARSTRSARGCGEQVELDGAPRRPAAASSRETMQPAHVSLWLRRRSGGDAPRALDIAVAWRRRRSSSCAVARRRSVAVATGHVSSRRRCSDLALVAGLASCSRVVGALDRRAGGREPDRLDLRRARARARRRAPLADALRGARRRSRRRLAAVATSRRGSRTGRGSSRSALLVCGCRCGSRTGAARRRRWRSWAERLVLVATVALALGLAFAPGRLDSSRTSTNPLGVDGRRALRARSRSPARPAARVRAVAGARSRRGALPPVARRRAAAAQVARRRGRRSARRWRSLLGVVRRHGLDADAVGDSRSARVACVPRRGRGRDAPLPPLRRRPRDLAHARLRSR